MMTFLEVLIKKVTLSTPSGSSCQIGDASFTVRYCSDIWEWEYRGETFWDVHDLAKAIARGGTATHQKVLFLSNKTKAGARSLKTRLLRLDSAGVPGQSPRKAFPVRPTWKTSPVPRRLVNFRSLRVS